MNGAVQSFEIRLPQVLLFTRRDVHRNLHVFTLSSLPSLLMTSDFEE